MKVKLLNSPFDFDEVGERTAQRWVRQGKADFTADGALLFRPRFVVNQQIQVRRDEDYDRWVNAERGGELCGEWVPAQCGAQAVGGPAFKTLQFDPAVHVDEETAQAITANP